MCRRGSSVAVNGRALALARVAEIRGHGGSGHAEQVGDLLDRVSAAGDRIDVADCTGVRFDHRVENREAPSWVCSRASRVAEEILVIEPGCFENTTHPGSSNALIRTDDVVVS